MARLAPWLLLAALCLLAPAAVAQTAPAEVRERMDAAFGQFQSLREANPAEALPHLVTAVTLADQVHGIAEPTTIRLRGMLAELYTQLDRPADAAWVTKVTGQRIEFDKAVKQAEALGEKQPAQAVTHLERAVELADAVFGRIHVTTLHLRDGLAALYGRLGRGDDARRVAEATRPRAELVAAFQRFQALNEERPAEAVAHLETVVGLADRVFSPTHPITLQARAGLAKQYRQLGRAADAERVTRVTTARTESGKAFQRYMALRDDKPAEAVVELEDVVRMSDLVYGPTGVTTIQLRNSLARLLYQRLDRATAAEEVFKETLARLEDAQPAPHPEQASTLDQLGFFYRDQRRYGDATAALERALALNEKALGPDHEDIGYALGFLGSLYQENGDYPTAEARFARALAVLEKALGPDNPELSKALNNLAALYYDQGRYAEAEPLYKRSVALAEKGPAADNPRLATNLNNLAALYNAQGRYEAAEDLYLRALELREEALGPDHPDVANSLNSLAGLYWERGDFEAAEIRYKRALDITEKALGGDHMDVARMLNNLALLLKQRCRFAEAEPLYLRALGIMEGYLGPDHPSIAIARTNLAVLHQTLGRTESAERLFRAALESRRKALAPEHPDIGVSLLNLAVLLMETDRLQEADGDFKAALAIFTAAYGADHPQVAHTLNNMAGLEDKLGRHDHAEALYRRSLAIQERLFGNGHPNIETGLENLVVHYIDLDRYGEALSVARRATDLARDRILRATGQKTTGARCERRDAHYGLRLHLRALAEAIREGKIDKPAGRAEAFSVAQLIAGGSAAQAVARMAARYAAGGDELAELVRKRQDAGNAWQKTDLALTEAVALPPEKRDAAWEAELRERLSALDREIAFADRGLEVRFPAYKELANPQALTLAEAQNLLAPDEGMVMFIPSQHLTFVFALRRDRSILGIVPLAQQDLDDIVRDMRDTLDPTGVTTADDIQPFDVETAYELYQAMLEPIADMLQGVRHLFVVPDGGLRSLPLGVLVTEKPQGPIDDFDAYRRVPWLARKYALTVLPSVSSLKSLRLFAGRARASKPFTGIGDPAFDGRPGEARGLKVTKLFTARGLADTRAVASLPRLPDTANELRAIADSLGAGDQSLVLGTRASETTIKSMDLSDSRVVAFATHGLMAGDFADLGEPALALTPPDKATAEDDGLLTAGEAARLKLNADWVVLSACNTAAADGTPGADGLSGLARAFFHAGARALLVSHWPVNSVAATRLTSRAFAIAAAEPGLGRSEAFTRSMLELMDDREKPYFAHPMFWAPFSIIGEGGTYRP